MLNIGYFKGQPTDYVIKYSAGKVAREGLGLAFYYWRHKTHVVAIPTGTLDANFIFNEATANFQTVAVQGQFSYRIAEPKKAAAAMNFAIDPKTRQFASDDHDRLPKRIANIIQMETRGEIQKNSLESTLGQSEAIAGRVLERTRASGALEPLGVELLNVYFISAKPTPEVAKALEADYRETLLRKADEAIYARRAAAVEEERKIKENEMRTQIAMEQKRRELLELEGANARQSAEQNGQVAELEASYRGKALETEAQHRARAIDLELGPYRSLDPKAILALAMKDLGVNAGRIGNLTITSEVLSALLDAKANS